MGNCRHAFLYSTMTSKKSLRKFLCVLAEINKRRGVLSRGAGASRCPPLKYQVMTTGG